MLFILFYQWLSLVTVLSLLLSIIYFYWFIYSRSSFVLIDDWFVTLLELEKIETKHGQTMVTSVHEIDRATGFSRSA